MPVPAAVRDISMIAHYHQGDDGSAVMDGATVHPYGSLRIHQVVLERYPWLFRYEDGLLVVQASQAELTYRVEGIERDASGLSLTFHLVGTAERELVLTASETARVGWYCSHPETPHGRPAEPLRATGGD